MVSISPFVVSSINIQITLIAIVTVAIIYLFTKDLRRNLPPGPWGLPVVGILPSLGKHPHEVLTKYANRYGAVFSGKMGNRLTIFVNDYTSMRDMFAKSGDMFADRPFMIITDAFTSGKGLVSGYLKNNLKEKRRFAMKIMRSFGMGKSSFEGTIVDEIEYLTREFMKAAEKNECYDPKHMLENAVSNVTCRIVFGKRYDYEDQAFRRFLTHLYAFLAGASQAASLNFIPLLKFLPRTGWTELSEDVSVVFDEFVIPELKEHKKIFDIDYPRDFIDEMFKEKLEQDKSGVKSVAYDRESRKQIVADLFAAGTETTSSTLKWALLYLALNPSIQLKVHQELDSVTCRRHPPSLSDKPKLVFCEAVVMETLRIRPAVPLGIPHAALEDTTYEGYTIPKGTPIISNLWAVMHDPNTWQEPERFNPERFIDVTGNLIKKNEFIPFSIGKD
ncbi:cytochrome P450 2U1-like [Anneissia japonica]|uniref:cytochrome P450 2U1-like n=1 Tax=Anneissia japonica TaxID=1529436 RepID=UPI001425789A|nr:cytochrome P450 2U1-like [Anneissia japonica]